MSILEREENRSVGDLGLVQSSEESLEGSSPSLSISTFIVKLSSPWLSGLLVAYFMAAGGDLIFITVCSAGNRHGPACGLRIARVGEGSDLWLPEVGETGDVGVGERGEDGETGDVGVSREKNRPLTEVEFAGLPNAPKLILLLCWEASTYSEVFL